MDTRYIPGNKYATYPLPTPIKIPSQSIRCVTNPPDRRRSVHKPFIGIRNPALHEKGEPWSTWYDKLLLSPNAFPRPGPADGHWEAEHLKSTVLWLSAATLVWYYSTEIVMLLVTRLGYWLWPALGLRFAECACGCSSSSCDDDGFCQDKYIDWRTACYLFLPWILRSVNIQVKS